MTPIISSTGSSQVLTSEVPVTPLD